MYELCYLDDEARESLTVDGLRGEFARLKGKGFYLSMKDTAIQLVAGGVIDRKEVDDVL